MRHVTMPSCDTWSYHHVTCDHPLMWSCHHVIMPSDHAIMWHVIMPSCDHTIRSCHHVTCDHARSAYIVVLMGLFHLIFWLVTSLNRTDPGITEWISGTQCRILASSSSWVSFRLVMNTNIHRNMFNLHVQFAFYRVH